MEKRRVSLTPTESKVLYILTENANNVCTFEQIIEHVWGAGNVGDALLVKAHIRHLRMKIEPDPNNPISILTVENVGYKLVRLEGTAPKGCTKRPGEGFGKDQPGKCGTIEAIEYKRGGK